MHLPKILTLFSIAYLGTIPAFARNACPDMKGTTYTYRENPGTGVSPINYKFWAIPVPAAKLNKVNLYSTAKQYNSKRPQSKPNMTCILNSAGANFGPYNNYLCRHLSGISVENPNFPQYILDKSGNRIRVSIFDDKAEVIQASCKRGKVYTTRTFKIKPCDNNGRNCGEYAPFIGVTVDEQIIDVSSKAQFQGF